MLSDKLTPNLKHLPYLTRSNLELVLGDNRRTVDYRLKSLVNRQKLIRLKPGFYVSSDYLTQETDRTRYLEYLGSIMKEPAYLSLEYALAKYGFIAETVFALTYITLKKPARFQTPIGTFTYRNIKQDLFNGYKFLAYKDSGVAFATLDKAIFDFFYFIRFSSLEEVSVYIDQSRFNWSVLKIGDKRKLKQRLIKLNNRSSGWLLQVLLEKGLV